MSLKVLIILKCFSRRIKMDNKCGNSATHFKNCNYILRETLPLISFNYTKNLGTVLGIQWTRNWWFRMCLQLCIYKNIHMCIKLHVTMRGQFSQTQTCLVPNTVFLTLSTEDIFQDPPQWMPKIILSNQR